MRDHYNKLKNYYKKKQAKEIAESGTVQTETEVDIALKDIVPSMEEALSKKKDKMDQKNKKEEQEVKQAKEMREKSMKTFSTSCDDDFDITPKRAKRARGKGGDAISFLKEKSEMEMPLKQRELELKEKELIEQREARKEANEIRLREISLREREIKLMEASMYQNNQNNNANMAFAMMQQQPIFRTPSRSAPVSRTNTPQPDQQTTSSSPLSNLPSFTSL